MPTFARVAGVNVTGTIDGHDIWDSLNYNTPSPRTEVLINLDDETPYSALISNDWKLIKGSTSNGRYDHWLGKINETERHHSFDNYGKTILQSPVGKALWPYSINVDNEVEDLLSAAAIEELRFNGRITCTDPQKTNHCNPLELPCLFNITADPCERNNLAAAYPIVVGKMLKRISEIRLTAKPPRNRPADRRSNPALFNNTWTWWYDELGIIDTANSDDGLTTTIKTDTAAGESNSSLFSGGDLRPQILTVSFISICVVKKLLSYC